MPQNRRRETWSNPTSERLGMWPLFGFGRPVRDRPEPYHSKLSLPAEGAVILLGAGASASVGAPLMRGFIDRARDYAKLNLFNHDTLSDVNATIDFYDSLRSYFRITEVDIENVETLLSLAELADVIPWGRGDFEASRFHQLAFVSTSHLPRTRQSPCRRIEVQFNP